MFVVVAVMLCLEGNNFPVLKYH